MKKPISPRLLVVIIILVMLVAFCLGFAIIGGLAIALGHLLLRFYPFSLFEATVLGVMIAGVTIFLITTLVKMLIPAALSPWPIDDRAADQEEHENFYRLIPTTRFYQTESERTWETWLHAELANEVYMGFQDEPHTVSNLSESQVQELAVRLSDLAVSILKRKTGARRLSISMTNLKHELTKRGQQVYDDRIMTLALNAINLDLIYYSPVLANVIRTRRWHEPAEIPED